MQVRGVRPFFSEKYDITLHPRYKYLSDADKKNTFDVDSYLSALRRKKRRVITEDEPFDLCASGSRNMIPRPRMGKPKNWQGK